MRALRGNYDQRMKKEDPDRLMILLAEIIPKAGCLIFCPTRRHCESLAKLVTSLMPDCLRDYRKEERMLLIESLKSESDCQQICSILSKSLEYGVAYHHGGLMSEERRLLEDAFASGVLCALVCTTTLSAGVNLPAQRVIIRAPFSGLNRLSQTQYMQMAGRAGRAQMCDSEGECYIYDATAGKVTDMFKSDNTPSCTVHSQFCEGYNLFILNLCVLGFVKRATDIEKAMNLTLLKIQLVERDDKEGIAKLSDDFMEAFRWLLNKKLLKIAGEDVDVTSLGRALFASRI